MAEYCTRPGRIRPILTIGIAALAALGVFASGAPTAVKCLLLAVIALAAYRGLALASAHVIGLESAGNPVLDGVRGTLFAEAATGLFIALGVSPPVGRTRRAFIFRDELEPDAFRAVLSFLRHG